MSDIVRKEALEAKLRTLIAHKDKLLQDSIDLCEVLRSQSRNELVGLPLILQEPLFEMTEVFISQQEEFTRELVTAVQNHINLTQKLIDKISKGESELERDVDSLNENHQKGLN